MIASRCTVVVRLLLAAAIGLTLVLVVMTGAVAAATTDSHSVAAAHKAKPKASKKKKHKPKVLLVGIYNDIPGHYFTIQEALKVAQEGDWILIGPGDYKQAETHPTSIYGDLRAGADILVTTPNIHIRGMNRNTVMIDGTKPGYPECSSEEAAQNFGPKEGSSYLGNNGVVVYKANGVTLQNLSTCNFLGENSGGDSVWFDGGGSTGKQELGSWWGEYLSSTSTYWAGTSKPSDEYGIYASNTYGPGYFTHDYANNMSDSGFYIGACPDCNTVLNEDRSEANDLGYSGSNSGGHLIIKNSVFNDNEEGFATTSQNNDDAPSPQEGLCPKGAENPTPPPGAQRKNICWELINSKITNNNNGGTPTNGGAPGLLGLGASLAGSRNDLVADDTFSGNDAWGILVVPYPGIEETPPEQVTKAFPEDECRGGVHTETAGKPECLYEPWGNEIEGNTFENNGSYGNPSNGDIGEDAQPSSESAATNDCYHGNVDKGGEPSSEPPAIQTTHGTCGQPDTGNPSATVAAEAACDSRLVAECPEAPGEKYPRTEVKLMPLPQEPGMANPCEGVPRRNNPWCKHGRPVGSAKYWQ